MNYMKQWKFVTGYVKIILDGYALYVEKFMRHGYLHVNVTDN